MGHHGLAQPDALGRLLAFTALMPPLPATGVPRGTEASIGQALGYRMMPYKYLDSCHAVVASGSTHARVRAGPRRRRERCRRLPRVVVRAGGTGAGRRRGFSRGNLACMPDSCAEGGDGGSG